MRLRFFGRVAVLLILVLNSSCSDKKEQSDFESQKVSVKREFWDRKKFAIERSILLENTKESHFLDLEKLKIEGDKIYVLDRYTQHKLFVFDIQGAFINAILLNQDGKSSEEKNTIWDFDVNSEGEIVLFDQKREKLFFYAIDGALLKSRELPFEIDAFACLKNGGNIFSVKKNGGLEEDSKVVVTDSNFNIVKSYFSYTKGAKDNKMSKYLFRDSPQGLVYNKAVDGFLVLFDKINGDVVKTYSVDFGENEMSQSIKDDYSLYQGEELTKYYCMYQTPFLVSNTLVGNMYVKRRNGLFAYDLDQNKSWMKSFKMGKLSLIDLNFPLTVTRKSEVVSYLDLRTYNAMKDRHLLDSVSKVHLKKGGVLLNFFKMDK